jgi:hypothetical protein
MGRLLSNAAAFLWVSRANGAIGLALTLLLLMTLIARRPALPTLVYVLSSLLGISAWIAFLFARVEVLYSPAGFLEPVVRALSMVLLPHVLLVEAGLLGWLGVLRPWRYCFLLPVVVGVFFIIWLLLGRARLSPHP